MRRSAVSTTRQTGWGVARRRPDRPDICTGSAAEHQGPAVSVDLLLSAAMSWVPREDDTAVPLPHVMLAAVLHRQTPYQSVICLWSPFGRRGTFGWHTTQTFVIRIDGLTAAVPISYIRGKLLSKYARILCFLARGVHRRGIFLATENA